MKKFLFTVLFSVFFVSYIFAADNGQFLNAVQSGNYKTVSSLLKEGADVNARNKYGESALVLALKGNYDKTAALMIKRGADINIKDSNGNTLLMLAAQNGLKKSAKLMIKKGAPVNAAGFEGITPLMMAARHGYGGIVRMFIKKGAQVNSVGKYCKTALDFAQLGKDEKTIKILKSAKAVNGKDVEECKK